MDNLTKKIDSPDEKNNKSVNPETEVLVHTLELDEKGLSDLLPTVIEIAIATGLGIDLVTNGVSVIDKKKRAIEQAAKTIHSWKQPKATESEEQSSILKTNNNPDIDKT